MKVFSVGIYIGVSFNATVSSHKKSPRYKGDFFYPPNLSVCLFTTIRRRLTERYLADLRTCTVLDLVYQMVTGILRLRSGLSFRTLSREFLKDPYLAREIRFLCTTRTLNNACVTTNARYEVYFDKLSISYFAFLVFYIERR
jgi:hypothetical protein